MKKWSKNERLLLAMSLVLLVLVGIKSVFFDGYQPKGEKEITVMELALEHVQTKPWIFRKVVKLKELDSQRYEHISLPHGYLVVVRKYFLGFLPIGETRVLE